MRLQPLSMTTAEKWWPRSASPDRHFAYLQIVSPRSPGKFSKLRESYLGSWDVPSKEVPELASSQRSQV